MTTKEKFNKFIEDEATKTEAVNIELMLKKHKENLKIGRPPACNCSPTKRAILKNGFRMR